VEDFVMSGSGWWTSPEEAAAGGLDHVPIDLWPKLAARWLAAGFDSESLRQLAQLQSGQYPARHREDRHLAALAALDLMPEVLRSLGFDPSAADTEFTARCQGAVDVVQRDLDVTGYGRYRMRARLGRGWPAEVYAALPEGSSGAGGMTRGMDDLTLLLGAAESVSATLKEVHEIEWPVCAAHGDDPMLSSWRASQPVVVIKKAAWWRCTRARHPLALVGQLTAEIAKTLQPSTEQDDARAQDMP
jgi:hypothetical protein